MPGPLGKAKAKKAQDNYGLKNKAKAYGLRSSKPGREHGKTTSSEARKKGTMKSNPGRY